MEDTQDDRQPESPLQLSAGIVAAYVQRNAISPAELSGLIVDVHGALQALSDPAPSSEQAQEPAVPVKKSVHPDAIVCLEDGKRFKSLRRHLRVHHGLSPEQYRQKWNLLPDYPLTAPSYAAQRSQLAKRMRLGKTVKKS